MSPNDISTQRFDLESREFSQSFVVYLKDFQRSPNTQASTYLDEFRNRQTIGLHHRLYCGKPQVEKHEVKYPAGWWNAFKAEYPRLCRWLKPATYVTVKVQWEGRVAFPELSARTQYQTVLVWNDPIFEVLR